MPSVRRGPVAAFLFFSGACALVYQIVWTRELRLIFGASTAASAAVLAIFIGGLGVGGLVLGKRADTHPSPLLLYANLEAAVAVSAAATPALLMLVRAAYLGAGGSTTLGTTLGTVLRLVLATLVLAIPACLMGGTLPAAIRAAQADDDAGRRHAALLYGANTFGAVCGALASTFVLLEVFGSRLSLWVACTLNLLVAMIARSVARSNAFADVPRPLQAPAPAAAASPVAPPVFVLFAALAAGFAFFLMELVWYRMLAPLLGGSHFTFGLILAVALFGIGAGGLSYAILGRNRPATLEAFALTSALEALFLAIPFALGDRIAILASSLRTLGSMGFWAMVVGWTATAAIVIVPAAFASGIQFPLLIALLGRGRAGVGRQVGLTYAWNTVGAIVGSLAGGFGLLPMLGAVGAWRFVGASLAILGLFAAVIAVRASRRPFALIAPVSISVLTFLALRAQGPTAAWRHTPIGAGRVPASDIDSPRKLAGWLDRARRTVIWEADGLESVVALQRTNDTMFLVNGKADGSFRSDAATQVMVGLVGACLHGAPKQAYVIGLGTGSSAGWLAAFPTIERLDVAEIEPVILRVAQEAAPVNHGVLANPRVHVHLQDAREGLLTTKRKFDLIVSEPSNPYRAGISSLFTREYYAAVDKGLAEDGLFLQWVQAYEIDAETLRSVYATIGSVFQNIETWELDRNDLLLVASRTPRRLSGAAIAQCLAGDVMKEAMQVAWQTEGLEGFLAHHVARASFGAHQQKMHEGQLLNTDDLNLLEFGVARRVGGEGIRAIDLVNAARARGERRPDVTDVSVDWSRVEDEAFTASGLHASLGSFGAVGPEHVARADAFAAYSTGDVQKARFAWMQQKGAPRTVVERLVMADVFASAGDEGAREIIAPLAGVRVAEAAFVEARLALAKSDVDAATEHAIRALSAMRRSPWGFEMTLVRALPFVAEVARRAPRHAAALYDAAKAPFAMVYLESSRRELVLDLARAAGWRDRCVEALAPFEPYPLRTRAALEERRACYADAGHPLSASAESDLADFVRLLPGAVDPDPAGAPAATP